MGSSCAAFAPHPPARPPGSHCYHPSARIDIYGAAPWMSKQWVDGPGGGEEEEKGQKRGKTQVIRKPPTQFILVNSSSLACCL